MEIADRIKLLREAYDITSNDLAKITGIHPVSIRKYETNKMVPGIEVIDKMCEALRLPRMVFEGIPKQYTDYTYEGDYYQLLFMLIATGTVNIEGFFNGNDEEDTHFSINPKLAQYVQIKNGDEIIPLENITIHPVHPVRQSVNIMDMYYSFDKYLRYLKNAEAALESKRWNTKSKGETKEEYATRMLEEAEKIQLKLMLREHSWEQYMAGIGHSDEAFEKLDEYILSGGDYYEYIMQADLPETMKERYIKGYEDAYVSEIIRAQNPPYPGNATRQEKDEWIKSMVAQERQYKLDHPDYKEQARKHAIENAQKARDAANNQ